MQGYFFWAFYSFPLNYMSVFMPIPHFFDYCSFGLSFETRRSSQMAIAVNNLPANAGDLRDSGSHHESRRSLGGEQPNPVFLPGESHGQRSLASHSP